MEIDELIGLITRVVTGAGGKVDSVRGVGTGNVVVDVQLPDAPMTVKRRQAIRELAKYGIKCSTEGNNGD